MAHLALLDAVVTKIRLNSVFTLVADELDYLRDVLNSLMAFHRVNVHLLNTVGNQLLDFADDDRSNAFNELLHSEHGL